MTELSKKQYRKMIRKPLERIFKEGGSIIRLNNFIKKYKSIFTIEELQKLLLSYALDYKNYEIIKELLDLGIKVNPISRINYYADNYFRDPALLESIYKFQYPLEYKIIQLLLQYKIIKIENAIYVYDT